MEKKSHEYLSRKYSLYLLRANVNVMHFISVLFQTSWFSFTGQDFVPKLIGHSLLMAHGVDGADQ